MSSLGVPKCLPMQVMDIRQYVDAASQTGAVDHMDYVHRLEKLEGLGASHDHDALRVLDEKAFKLEQSYQRLVLGVLTDAFLLDHNDSNVYLI